MSWFYAIEGQQQCGPVEAAELRALIAAGTVKRSDLAWRPEMSKWTPIARLKELEVETPFFAVSLLKLAVMTTVTFGVYGLYWSYRQWKAVQRRTGMPMWPWARGWFAWFFLLDLCKEVVRKCEAAGVEVSISTKPLPAAYFLLNLCWRLPEPFHLIGFLSAVPLVLLQNEINDLHAAVVPGANRNARFTWANVAGILVGGFLVVLIILDTT
jgi:hypothetical protein